MTAATGDAAEEITKKGKKKKAKLGMARLRQIEREADNDEVKNIPRPPLRRAARALSISLPVWS